MADETQPAPSNLVWLAGFVVGMSVENARQIGQSARTDAEPRIGRVAGIVLEGAVFIVWLALITWLTGWFFRRRWVRAAFRRAEPRRDGHA